MDAYCIISNQENTIPYHLGTFLKQSIAIRRPAMPVASLQSYSVLIPYFHLVCLLEQNHCQTLQSDNRECYSHCYNNTALHYTPTVTYHLPLFHPHHKLQLHVCSSQLLEYRGYVWQAIACTFSTQKVQKVRKRSRRSFQTKTSKRWVVRSYNRLYSRHFTCYIGTASGVGAGSFTWTGSL